MFLVMLSPWIALTWWSKAVYLAANHQNLVSTADETCGSASVNCEPPQSVNDVCGSK